MKKLGLFLSFIFPLMLLLSCGKEEDPIPQTQGNLKFKVDGKWIEYAAGNQLMGFALDPSGPMYLATASILGNPVDGTKNFLSISVRNESNFQTGIDYQMQDLITYKGAPMVRILLTYSDEIGQLYNAVLVQQTIPGLKVTDDATLRFTKIDSKWVEGTFSGVLLGPISSLTGRGNTELLITEGQFSLPMLSSIP
ncbi:hypothetical protein [Algoriphagus confluentis]|uniref:Lipid-binding hydrolase n=1 Tax=Algoriphagus confluentis TaxID=1697556 RepID=A0ABQ6PRJ5_9BACT|nr:hypothetical protein Aconfl_32260 [Algoriphagus confluentis]